jgi:DNA-binding MarR family transcriptional regulator
MGAFPRVEEQLCFALYATSRAVVQSYQPLLSPLGLTYLQYLVLLALWERDGQLVKELGEGLELDSGTLTPLLQRMEAAKLVSRRRGSSDRRQVRIHLAAGAVALRGPLADLPARLMCRYGAMAPSTLQAVATLRDALTDLRSTLRDAAPVQQAPDPPKESRTPGPRRNTVRTAGRARATSRGRP